MISYTLPGMSEFSDIDLLFCTFFHDVPDIFFDDIKISSVYGGFGTSSLCGGRNTLNETCSEAQVQSLVEKYNNLGIACNVTFSNQFADTRAIKADAFSQHVLEILSDASTNEIQNGVILFTDDMNEYVQSNYPSLLRISSTTKEIEDIGQLECELHAFDRVVLNYNLLRNFDIFSHITLPNRLEVMVNEYCTPHCPYRKKHYQEISRSQKENALCTFQCRHEPAPQMWSFLNGLIEGNVFLKNEEVRTYANEYKVESFKIVGRGLSRYDIIDSYLYYLVKPEHWYEIRDYLIHRNYL